MKNNQREKNLSFLKGILSGKRSMSELIRAEPLFLYHYDTLPGQFYISGRAETFDIEKGTGLHNNETDRILNEIQYKALLKNPRYTVTLIRITYE